jgi:hypothetical protein
VSGVTLWVRRGAIESHWQLGDFGAGTTSQALLFGWDMPDALDGSVPQPVARAWARALVVTARVTFLSSDSALPASSDWRPRGAGDDDFTQALAPPGLLAGTLALLRGQRGPVGLVCSQHATTVERAFTDPGFAWWLQSQVLLLSALDAPPPSVAPDDVLALLGRDWATRARSMQARGIVGVARPAVDGDAFGLLVLESGLGERLLRAIAGECEAAGLDWAPAF